MGTDPYVDAHLPLDANGRRLKPGDRVRFERPVYRFTTATVLEEDGPMVKLQLGKHPPRRRVLLCPAGWLELLET